MMNKKPILFILSAALLFTACNDTFTVDETKYRGKKDENGCEFIYIQNPECSKDNPGCPIDGNVIDFSWNFEHQICPGSHPYCLKDKDDRHFCSKADKIDEIVGCKVENEIKYQNNLDGICIPMTCINKEWTEDANSERKCKNNVSCRNTNEILECGECHNNDIKCENDSNGFGIRYKCIAGTWKEMDGGRCMFSSMEPTSCNPDGITCAQCKNGERQRIDKNDPKTDESICTAQICENGVWRDEPNIEEHQCTTTTADGKTRPVWVSCRYDDHGVASCGDCLNGETKCENGPDANNKMNIGHVWNCKKGLWIENADGCKATDSNEPLSCDKSNTKCGVCINEHTKYENSFGADNTAICSSMTCADGQWQLDTVNLCTNTVSCKLDEHENKKCGDCVNGNSRCADENGIGQIQTCENGIWIKSYFCHESRNCRNIEECRECTEDDTKYQNDDNNKCERLRCSEGVWTKDDEYSCDYECDFSKLKDKDADPCVACKDNDIKCSTGTEMNAEITQCFGGIWKHVKDCTSTKCWKDQKQCNNCDDGDEKFEEDNAQICHHYRCNVNENKWSDDTPDGIHVSCNKDNKGYGECLNNTARCNENSLQICIHGAYETVMTCPDGCEEDAEKKKARCSSSCEIDSVSCSGGILSQCTNGILTSEYCELGTCADSNDCAECLETICINDVSTHIGSLIICESNKIIGEETSPHSYSCNAIGNGYGNCLNGSYRCISDGEDQAIQEICFNGDWAADISCGQNSCAADKCGECANGSKRCFNGDNISYKQECQEGRWVSLSDCGTNSCDASAEECGECKNKVQKCEPMQDPRLNQISTCINGKWSNPTTCEQSCHIDGQTITCGACKDSSTKHEQHADQVCRAYSCKNGAWEESSACSQNVSCKTVNDAQTCGDCHNFTITYERPNLYTCLNGIKLKHKCGLWWAYYGKEIGDYMACSNPEDDNITCYMNNNIGYNRSNKKKCNSPSGPDVSCTVLGSATTQCGSCLNGATRCADGIQQTCVNGRWGYDRQCVDGCENNICKI